jgi:hypothetical protein
MGANHAMAPVPSTLKRAEEEVLPFLFSAEKRTQMIGIRNASNAMERQGIYLSGI